MKKDKKTGGRVKGTPNKTTAAIRDAINEADPIGFLIKALTSGNLTDKEGQAGEKLSNLERIRIAEFLAKKTTPDAKERAVVFDVGTIDNAEAAQTAMGRVIEVMGRGEITPSEASSVTSVIQNYLRAYELSELTEKVSDIEKALKKRKEAI